LENGKRLCLPIWFPYDCVSVNKDYQFLLDIFLSYLWTQWAFPVIMYCKVSVVTTVLQTSKKSSLSLFVAALVYQNHLPVDLQFTHSTLLFKRNMKYFLFSAARLLSRTDFRTVECTFKCQLLRDYKCRCYCYHDMMSFENSFSNSKFARQISP